MQCSEVESRFADYVNNSLSQPVRSEVQEHLATCTVCAEEVEAMKDIWMSLGSIRTEVPDRQAMRARFDVMLDAYRQGLEHRPSTIWWKTVNTWLARWWPQQPMLQFGLAMTLLTVGVIVGHQYRVPVPSPTAPTAAQSVEFNQMRNELHDMRQMVAISLLQQQSASERLKGVNWSNQIDQPNSEVLDMLLDTLMRDPNVNVRLAAVDALKKFGQTQVVRQGVLQALKKQDAPMVQVALIDYVVDTQYKESAGALKELTQNNSVNETVRQRAEWGLEHLQ
jgi:anti-sigma factor RsiW